MFREISVQENYCLGKLVFREKVFGEISVQGN